MADTQVILTSGTSYTVPSDWGTTSTIEAIGGGGSGGSNSRSGGGGGGGGGTDNPSTGGNGGSGVVIVVEPQGAVSAPGVWTLNEVYDNVKADTWS